MRILTDTCDALWFFSADARLDARKNEALRNPENTIFFSTVSAAEVSIKYSIGKLSLPAPPSEYLPRIRESHLFTELPLVESASLLLDQLPFIHRDPFDRLLICQALAHDLTLLSSDPLIHQYTELSHF